MFPTIKDVFENFSPSDLIICSAPSSSTTVLPTHQSSFTNATVWTSFEEDLKSASNYDRNTRLLGPLQFNEALKVRSEQDVAFELRSHIQMPFRRVLQALGYNYYVSSHNGLECIRLDPDGVLIDHDDTNPLCVLEFKTPWAFPIDDSFQVSSDEGSKIGSCVAQLYGYMSYNHLKYGILSNYDHFIFFARDSDSSLRYSRPIPKNRVLQVLVDFFFLIKNDSIYTSPSGSPIESLQVFKGKARSNSLMELGPSFYRFGENVGHTKHGGVIKGNLGGLNQPVIFKVKNICREQKVAETLQDEADVYYDLREIQGTAIPTLHAHADLNGVFRALIFQDAGENMEDENDCDYVKSQFRTNAIMESAMEALGQMHQLGYLHGDIASRNLCMITESVMLVDLGNSKKCDSQQQFEAEMKSLKRLFNLDGKKRKLN